MPKNRIAILLMLLSAAWLHAQDLPQSITEQDFVSGGTIRVHLESGGYTISPLNQEKIVVSCETGNPERSGVKVKIKRSGANADVFVSHTPHNNFRATIEVPSRSNLWVRLTAGEMVVEGVEGDKDIEAHAGQIQIDVPHPDEYGQRDASVITGEISSNAFNVSKGGLFRSFDQKGPGHYRLHAHLLAGEIDLRGTN